MASLSKREIKALNEELEKLREEQALLKKLLGYVRLAKQKNKIEGLEVQSKIRELTGLQNNSLKKIQDADALRNCDDPSVVNQIKLNLDVNSRINYEAEEESEDSID